MEKKVKILIIRFSSIGDIVLTTPVIRCLRKKYGDTAEIHYLTKKAFVGLLVNNPYLDKVVSFEKEVDELIPSLKEENFDFIVDLHKNLRSKRVKLALRKKTYTFSKLNFKKFLLVKLKVNRLPKIHIVERYLNAVRPLGVENDNEGLDYFITNTEEVNPESFGVTENYIAFAIGAQFATKVLPTNKIIEILDGIKQPVVLLGGKMDQDKAKEIIKGLPNSKIIDTCGKYSISQSASIVKGASVLITHDTGLMHIASAFDVPIVSIWGNTVPDLGMYAYRPKNPSSTSIHEVEGLKCRPCSKIGYKECPKGHFDCMQKQNAENIAQDILKKVNA